MANARVRTMLRFEQNSVAKLTARWVLRLTANAAPTDTLVTKTTERGGPFHFDGPSGEIFSRNGIKYFLCELLRGSCAEVWCRGAAKHSATSTQNIPNSNQSQRLNRKILKMYFLCNIRITSAHICLYLYLNYMIENQLLHIYKLSLIQ